ncbi:2Fe-2S iron-sulfur cluster-binding protein [Mycolicibacterium diernhoferi]|uniref:(2Fe-2S)-binding protein n=1 Tax=Mycolicibacterium diernhoferi TaxID=1801 RepID=A0A1Q4HEW4_9MYCO|nr:2Fe-2S iron-sulfur cluster-binding protein [Mycolicibacterium diernhoferi]OJZ66089.1 (2Fe-2S)-binding protein [Mycolicibacterium diernhoferi]OPE55361.1 (2Fe-2S)-binding protein [Mycolicibacterium diernhoferi]PEG54550.1 (2Fe-2S)-binding protein [Mycolicibacterium diernhoferi]QYL23999.1 (2Fe-2S)-binding protein [Mycolicibacterium diernhoferi]
MPTVTVRPSGITFEATPGQTVMAAALDAGLRWPTVCGGQGDCLVCHVEVVDGPEHLAAPSDIEAQAVRGLSGDKGGRGEHVRLACQAGVHGDVVVMKRGVREAHPENPGVRVKRTQNRQEAPGVDG